MRFLFFLSALTGCQTVSTHRFDLPGNPIGVVCKEAHLEPCGLSVSGCGNESSLEFECLKDVHYVSPWSGPTVPADYAPEANQ